MEAVRSAVTAGLGLGLLPMYIVGDALRQGQLERVLPAFEAAPHSAIYLVYVPNRTLSLRVRSVVDFLVDWFGPIPPWERGL
jgi:DNA-binding transcriptional LysR family regulator